MPRSAAGSSSERWRPSPTKSPRPMPRERRMAAIWLERPGAGTRVRSWTPLEGPYLGFLVTHAESISIADYLTVRDGGRLVYRPTVHYAYHPCDGAVLSLHELAGRAWQVQPALRQLHAEDIVKEHTRVQPVTGREPEDHQPRKAGQNAGPNPPAGTGKPPITHEVADREQHAKRDGHEEGQHTRQNQLSG